jgi:hypothetical protein
MVRAINSNNEPKTSLPTEFTPAQATRMLPLVRQIVQDLMSLNKSIEAQRQQLRGVDELPETIEQSNYRDELSDVRRSLADDEQQFAVCMSELNALGVKAHQPLDGSVDFPAMMNRRRVCLCWNPQDPEVAHWHEIGQEHAPRQRVDPTSFAESMN